MTTVETLTPGASVLVARPAGDEQRCKRLSRRLYYSLLACITFVAFGTLVLQAVLLGNDGLFARVAMVMYVVLAWMLCAYALAALALAVYASIRRVPCCRSYWFSLACYACGAAVAFGLLLAA